MTDTVLHQHFTMRFFSSRTVLSAKFSAREKYNLPDFKDIAQLCNTLVF